MLIDLRSDTVTKPTPGMLAAMWSAPVGDDVYGEDPTVRRLEQAVAAMLGFEAALFVPSGTMANQLAIALHTCPGDSVIAEEGSHVVVFEAGAAAALSGVQFDLLPRALELSDQGVANVYRDDSLHTSATTLLVAENSHNVGGGRVLSAHTMQRIARHAATLGMRAHCDGARLWNAAVALRTDERDLLAGFTTAAVCFSKGLGAPVGSALCGPAVLIERGRKLRKRLGGAMRQAGYLAAACLYALEHHRARLDDDHAQAQALATTLSQLVERGAPLEVHYPTPGTNMVYLRVGFGVPAEHLAALERQGVRLIAMGGGWLRAVFHLDVPSDAAARAAAAISSLLGS